MMPEMDGYETMQQIRAQPGARRLPLIAVTAKAMKGDRQKCLDAGASDYIAKPVDIDLLLALLRVWIAPFARRRRDAADAGRGRGGMTHELARHSRRSLAEAPDGHRRPDARMAASGRACWSSTTTSATCSRSAPCSRTSPRSSSRRSGEEALRQLLKGEFAVILLDVFMPGMDGYETAQIDPQPRADQAHPDRLPVRGQQGDRASDARLCDGRGRLCVQAGRPDRAAIEGRGVRRPVRDDARRSSARPRQEQALLDATICGPMPSGCRPSRSCAAPSSARRRSSSRCRSSSISKPLDVRAALPQVRQRQSRGDDRLQLRAGRWRIPTLWADRLHPDDRDRVLAALPAARARRALLGRISLALRRRQLQAFPRPGRAAARRATGSRSNSPAR